MVTPLLHGVTLGGKHHCPYFVDEEQRFREVKCTPRVVVLVSSNAGLLDSRAYLPACPDSTEELHAGWPGFIL